MHLEPNLSQTLCSFWLHSEACDFHLQTTQKACSFWHSAGQLALWNTLILFLSAQQQSLACEWTSFTLMKINKGRNVCMTNVLGQQKW